jgi:hypothetical protein
MDFFFTECKIDGCCGGAVVGEYLVQSAEKCLEKCKDSVECKWYTYLKADRLCFLEKDCRVEDRFDVGVGTCNSGEKTCTAAGTKHNIFNI